jgi:hypothetical protein
MDCKVIVVVRSPEGIDFRAIGGPAAFPGVDEFNFGSMKGLVAGVGKMEDPMIALRNEAGRVAGEMFIASAQKNSV